MSLLTAHKILIATAVIFFLGFSAWELNRYWTSQDLWAALRSATYMLTAIGFSVYLGSLRRWIK